MSSRRKSSTRDRTPQEAFWHSDQPVELTIGSRLEASDPAVSRFKRWLLDSYGSWKRRQPESPSRLRIPPAHPA